MTTTKGVAVQLLAAYLGVTPTRVKQVIAHGKIQSVGTAWKAKLYDPTEVIRHAREMGVGANASDSRPS